MLSIILSVIAVFHLVEDAGLQDFLVEITAVELHAENGFIQSLQLRDGELLVQQPEAYGLEVDVLAQPLHRLPEDVVVVESQSRHFIQGEPLRFGSIVAPLHLRFPCQGVESDGDDAGAWVAVDVGERPDLLDIAQVEPCFLFQLTQGALLCRLVHVEESSREGPSAFEGLNPALDEQDFQVVAVETEDDTVCRYSRSRILVGVLLRFHIV